MVPFDEQIRIALNTVDITQEIGRSVDKQSHLSPQLQVNKCQ